MRVVELHVNGTTHRLEVDAERSLLSVLRDELDLTGSKYGCGEGQCGACTVLVDGRAVRSCLPPVHTVAGKPITTIEGLARHGRLHPLQEAFLAVEALQCGYCTAGMIMSGVALLQQQPQPDRGRDPPRHGRQHLPLRHLSTRRRGHSARRATRPDE